MTGKEAPLVSLLVRSRARPSPAWPLWRPLTAPALRAWRQALPRPFTKLRELDMDKAAADIIAALP